MILIFSTKRMEPTTLLVADWIRHLGASCQVVCGEDLIFPNKISLHLSDAIDEASFVIDGVETNCNTIKAVWFRRPGIIPALQLPSMEDVIVRNAMMEHHLEEHRAFRTAFYAALGHASWVGHPSTSSPSKFRQLQVAKNCGLKIPPTLLTTSKDAALDFERTHGPLITKAISEGLHFTGESRTPYSMFTSTVARQQLQELEHHMAPTLLQGHVKKRFDIRTFFLDGTCYSVAIRSQKDAQTQIDFRNFNWDHPNRSLPYRLGEEIHKKIRTFMAEMRLETGSLDFVLSESEDLFFLEVNPVGQFGMVSEPGNYYLEKEMAMFLLRKAAS